jgi:hypothetical protein
MSSSVAPSLADRLRFEATMIGAMMAGYFMLGLMLG